MSRFEPGDTVTFTHEKHWMIGEVEEIRQGHEGDNLLVVRQGGPWSGSRYVVLSSCVKKLFEKSGHTHIDKELIMGEAFQGNMTELLN